MSGLRIGEIANQAGVSTATIRYYERAGLMPKPARSQAGYRLYPERAVEELALIRRAQAIGFSLDEIRELLRLSRGGQAPCARVISLAEAHLMKVDERIRQLRAFRDRLGEALGHWRAGRCGFSSQGLCDLLEDVEPSVGRSQNGLWQERPLQHLRLSRQLSASRGPRERGVRER